MTTQDEAKTQPVLSHEFAADNSNILDFSTTLKELRKNVDPELVRHRETSRDRNGNIRTVDYVEWHTVADVLDRDLYKKEVESPEPAEAAAAFPADPVAKTLAEMVTTKQLGMIRAVAREVAIDADKECLEMLKCRVSELSRRAASAFIDHLRELKPQELPLRKVG